MSDEHEVGYRTNALGVTREWLPHAVDAVMTSAAKIREHLAS